MDKIKHPHRISFKGFNRWPLWPVIIHLYIIFCVCEFYTFGHTFDSLPVWLIFLFALIDKSFICFSRLFHCFVSACGHHFSIAENRYDFSQKFNCKNEWIKNESKLSARHIHTRTHISSSTFTAKGEWHSHSIFFCTFISSMWFESAPPDIGTILSSISR